MSSISQTFVSSLMTITIKLSYILF